jgi:HSP20 family molecular chaperone IbpA
MKNKNAFYALLLSLVLLLMSAAQLALAQSNSDRTNRKSETYQVANFDQLRISGPFEVALVQDGNETLSIDAPADDFEDIEVRVSGNTLEIRFERNNWGGWNNRNNRRFYAKLSVKSLRQINTSASATLRINGTLKADQLQLQASSGSDIEGALEAKEVECEASSGADIDLTGTTQTLAVDVSSGADVNARNLKAVRCTVEVSSGADAEVYASEEIDAGASSGGDVRYWGNPPRVKSRSSSGGGVSGRGGQ